MVIETIFDELSSAHGTSFIWKKLGKKVNQMEETAKKWKECPKLRYYIKGFKMKQHDRK